jgi:hypothetical protein
MSRKLTSLAVCIAVLLTAAGCERVAGQPRGALPTEAAAADSPIAADEAPDDRQVPVRPDWTRPLPLLTQPVVAGSTAVVLVRARGDEIDVVGVGVGDGEVRWRHPFSPARVAEGYELGVDLVADADGVERVVFQRPGTGEALAWEAPVVAVDPASGRVVRRTPPLTLTQPVEGCEDGQDACLVVEGLSAYGDLRFDLSTGELVPVPVTAPLGGRSLGEQLYDDGQRPDEGIGRVVEGEVRWRRSVVEVFGPGRTSDAGWSFERDRRSGVYWGSLGWSPPGSGRTTTFAGQQGAELFARTQQITGFSAATGRRLWQLPRAEPLSDCRAAAQSLPVACWTRGRIQVRPRHWWVAEAGLLGFDPRTGDVRWRVSAGRQDLLSFLVTPTSEAAVGPDGAVIRRGRAAVLVDLRDGSTRRLAPDQVLLCRGAPQSIDYALAVVEGAERRGDGMLRPCRADGRPTPRPTLGAVARGGTAAGAWRLIGTARGLAGYRLPDGSNPGRE